MSFRARIARIARRAPRRAEEDDRQAAQESEEHTFALMAHRIGEGPAPGPLSVAAQAWRARQPPFTAEESAALLARLRHAVGEVNPDAPAAEADDWRDL